METLMDVSNLCVTYGHGPGAMRAVRNVSFNLGRERLGIVGESGSGKSTIGRALLKLLPTATITADRMDFMGTDLIGASERRMLDIRGARISMILQDPKFSLNPVQRVGDQIAEAYAVHHRGQRREAREKALEMLEAVQIRDPERVARWRSTFFLNTLSSCATTVADSRHALSSSARTSARSRRASRVFSAPVFSDVLMAFSAWSWRADISTFASSGMKSFSSTTP